jgi:hypothetical protein
MRDLILFFRKLEAESAYFPKSNRKPEIKKKSGI